MTGALGIVIIMLPDQSVLLMLHHLLDVLTAFAGVSLILWVFSDVFQSIIVPHYRPGHFRLSPVLSCMLWLPLRWLAGRFPESSFVRAALTMFAPAAVLTLLGCWMTLMVLGYSLVLWSERSHITPHLHNIADAFYFAATSVLTIGFGDVVACTFLARVTVICSAVSGIVLLALTVSFLFATQSHFHNREVNAQIISARSQYICNGVLLFDAMRRKTDATALLELCERWIIDIYQSHTAYPFLVYFRSRSSRNGWIPQMGTVLDAASLMLTIGPEKYSDAAHSIFDTGCRALSVFTAYLTLRTRGRIVANPPTEDYHKLFIALGEKDAARAAAKFASYRTVYLADLHRLCNYFVVAPPELNFVNTQLNERFQANSPALSNSSQQKLPAPGMTAEFQISSNGLVPKSSSHR